MKKIAFIGGGTMGTALASAACRGNDPADVVVTDVVAEKAQKLAQSLGCTAVATNSEAVEAAKFVVFCVKPQFLDGVLAEVKDTFAACAARGGKKVIVSIVAGIEVAHYQEMLQLDGKNVSVIRTLPNTACKIGKGFILIEEGKGLSYTEEDEAELMQLLREAGGFETLPATMFVAGSVLTSTSPAFIAMFANSLADAGVYNGLLRPQARRLALQGILCATHENKLVDYLLRICTFINSSLPGFFAAMLLIDRFLRPIPDSLAAALAAAALGCFLTGMLQQRKKQTQETKETRS